MSDPRSETRKGWAWFDRSPQPQDIDGEAGDGLPDADRDLRIAYARCFANADGEKVIAHLRALTLDRAFGPDAPDRTLRHFEGQRQLVAYILAQCERGRAGS